MEPWDERSLPRAAPVPLDVAPAGGGVALVFAWLAVGFGAISVPGAIGWLPFMNAHVTGLYILLVDLSP